MAIDLGVEVTEVNFETSGNTRGVDYILITLFEDKRLVKAYNL